MQDTRHGHPEESRVRKHLILSGLLVLPHSLRQIAHTQAANTQATPETGEIFRELCQRESQRELERSHPAWPSSCIWCVCTHVISALKYKCIIYQISVLMLWHILSLTQINKVPPAALCVGERVPTRVLRRTCRKCSHT